MFSKSKINEPGPKQSSALDTTAAPKPAAPAPVSPAGDSMAQPAPAAPKQKPIPSVLGSDLTVTGNLRTTGDIQVEGTVKGDIRAHLLTVGEQATIEGEIIADDIVITGRVIGKVRGLKVRLTSTARVEGDIIHKTIAIESGAHFEGSVHRAEDPLATGSSSKTAAASSNSAATTSGARAKTAPTGSTAPRKAADADASDKASDKAS